MRCSTIDILFISIFIVIGSIWAYISYLTFYVDSDEEDIIEEEYNNPLLT